MGRLLIVSNRLPVSFKFNEGGALEVVPTAGGLATGLKGPHEESGGLWIGWPGDTTGFSPEALQELERQLTALRTVPCLLSKEEVLSYYEGMANGVLWPLFHYLLDLVPYRTNTWTAYTAVNERFAKLTAEHYQPGDTIWVQDYQLLLVPAMLREMLPDARIGLFLHIPFPGTEAMRIFPWREELLAGMLGADLVGFHTLSYARHFGNSLIHLLGLTPDVDRVRYGGRTVRFGAFPMGIDAPTFDREAREPQAEQEAAKVRQEAAGTKLLLGIDRLDYTKGIPRRLMAMERLLETHPELRGKVRLVQIAVPSRVDVQAYGEFTGEVNELVGRINGAFGTPTWVPIHYLYRSFSQRELVGMYRAADVMLVTPLRDGMNLVAKEFVACRPDEQGVLVLSELAGAAAEMGADALLVNPYDIESTAEVLHTALQMPEAEQRSRMQSLRSRVAAFDVHRWARTFLQSLQEAGADARRDAPAVMTAPLQAGILARVREAEELLLLLDYDGTLTNFSRRPELASPGPALLGLLDSLARHPRYRVHLVSGRPAAVLESWFGALGVGLHAEHGLSSRYPGQAWKENRLVDTSWMPRVRELLEEVAARTPGSLVEEKGHSLAWHHRGCDPEFGDWQARELKIHLAHALSNVPVAVLAGDRVVEVQPHGVNKGWAATEILAAFPKALPLAAGDDETDENLFAALPEEGITIHVGSRPSRARYNVRDPNSFRRLLSALTQLP